MAVRWRCGGCCSVCRPTFFVVVASASASASASVSVSVSLSLSLLSLSLSLSCVLNRRVDSNRDTRQLACLVNIGDEQPAAPASARTGGGVEVAHERQVDDVPRHQVQLGARAGALGDDDARGRARDEPRVRVEHKRAHLQREGESERGRRWSSLMTIRMLQSENSTSSRARAHAHSHTHTLAHTHTRSPNPDLGRAVAERAVGFGRDLLAEHDDGAEERAVLGAPAAGLDPPQAR